MDALSDVLAMLRVSSALSSRFEGRGRWAFRFPAYRHIKFGGVLHGRFHLWMEKRKPSRVFEEGDFYMLTNGQPFCSASDPACPLLDGPATYRAIRGEDGVVRFQGGQAGAHPPVSLASGRFTFENDVSEILLRHLPPLIHLPARLVGTSSLSLLLALLKTETQDSQPGGEVARSSLAALTLVHVLRMYLEHTRAPRGWLGALKDPRVGRALALMHGQAGERWTLEALAAQVAMSRTAFAARFRELVGAAPMDYLHRWRMALARTALRHSDDSLASIADRVGYLSDTAFSIAFKRSHGQSPGRFRHEARANAAD